MSKMNRFSFGFVSKLPRRNENNTKKKYDSTKYETTIILVYNSYQLTGCFALNITQY